jgi:mono/diheme cytochrome c family protein
MPSRWHKSSRFGTFRPAGALFVYANKIAYNGRLPSPSTRPHFFAMPAGSRYTLLALIVVAIALGSAAPRSAGEVVFDRDILPILSDKCFLCHGPDSGTRQADLRLDLAGAGVDHGAIVPGKPDESPLVERITSSDADVTMPPPSAKLRLSDKEKELLAQWVAEGAEYGEHWAFRPLPDESARAGSRQLEVGQGGARPIYRSAG